MPRLWSDSSTGIMAAKRIGPGSKVRRLEVCEFYVQDAVQAGKVLLRKVKGAENPGNLKTRQNGQGSAGSPAISWHGRPQNDGGRHRFAEAFREDSADKPAYSVEALASFQAQTVPDWSDNCPANPRHQTQDQQDEDEILDLA